MCMVSVFDVSILSGYIWIIQSFQVSWPHFWNTTHFDEQSSSWVFFVFSSLLTHTLHSSLDILIALIIESCQHGCSIQIYCIIRSNWLSLSTLHFNCHHIVRSTIQNHYIICTIFEHTNHSSFLMCTFFFSQANESFCIFTEHAPKQKNIKWTN